MRRRIARYAAVYVAIMIAFAFFGPDWRTLDWLFFAAVAPRQTPPLDDDVVILDVPYQDDRARYRARLAAALDFLARASPRKVVVDVYFERRDEEIEHLAAALRALVAANVLVIGTVTPWGSARRTTTLDPGYMQTHAARLYGLMSCKGHTRYDHFRGVVKYEPVLTGGDAAGIEELMAVPVATAANCRRENLSSAPVLVSIGKEDSQERQELRRRIHVFPETSGGQGSSIPPGVFRNRTVVVGSLAKDSTDFPRLSGPEFVALAINERLLPADRASKLKVLSNPLLLIALVLALPAFSAVFFWEFFLRVRRLRSRLAVVAILSVGVSFALLAAWVYGLSLLDFVYPQVTLVAIGILAAAGLSWHFLRRWLELTVTQAPTDGVQPAPPEAYDVFISYSRDHSDWVKQHVLEPLRAARHADGSPFRIFFDQRSIAPGVWWRPRLVLAIGASRIFIPVATEDYFRRPTCLYEMELAALRGVKVTTFVRGIKRGRVDIPAEYNMLNFLDVEENPDFIEQVILVVIGGRVT